MRLKTVVDEDFTNYRKPAMFIGTVSCGGKCCIEAGLPLSVCQNDGWRSRAPIEVSDAQLCERYLSNPITQAIVLGGLEPFEQFQELDRFLFCLRGALHCDDDMVIYTGYTPEEIDAQVSTLAAQYPNIVVKFGRYIPGDAKHYDDVLGVALASDNQFARRIS